MALQQIYSIFGIQYMYRSYTLNSYLDSLLKGGESKNPPESANKSQGAGLTSQPSASKTESNADSKQATKTMHSSFMATPAKAEPKFQEPLRYQKSSSISTYSHNNASDTKSTEPPKHQILSTGTYYKYNSDTKPQIQQSNSHALHQTAPSKITTENIQNQQASKPQFITTPPTITTTPIKVVNPEANLQPLPQIVNQKPPIQVVNEPKIGIERKDSINSEQSNLFSEFKIKYDELKMNYDKLRLELDEVTREKKKLEIKFLNANPEYYEKQIKRLRAEVEKYQEENEDNKYKYLQAENGKKQYEASAKVKQEELKVIIKQLQKQKISNVQLRHQNDEKERVFGRIKLEFERSNQSTLKNYDEAVTRANRLDGALKTRNAEYDQLHKTFERLDRKLTETKQQYKKYKEVNDEKIKNLTKISETKNIEYIKIKSQLNSKIDQLNDEIEKLKAERVSADLLKTRKTEQVSIMKSNRQLELDVVRLEDRVRLLEYQLVQKDEMIIELQKTINKIKIDDQIKDLEERIASLQEQKNDILREHQKTKGELMKQNETLRLELMRAPEKVIHAGNANFQEILRVQLEQNSKLKRQLSHKIDQVYNLKSDIDELKVEKQNLLSEMDVLKKIKKSEEKNVKIQAEIASQHIRNDIESYKRKIQLLEVKLNLKSKQVKEKDAFIMNSVLGRCKQEEVPLVLADFQRIFEANYVERIAEANQRIEDLVQAKR